MAKGATKLDLAHNWAEVYGQIEAYLNDATDDFGVKASVGLDLLDLALASLARQGLLSLADVQILGNTGNSKKEIQYKLVSVYDEDADEDRFCIRKTDNEESEL